MINFDKGFYVVIGIIMMFFGIYMLEDSKLYILIFILGIYYVIYPFIYKKIEGK